jgi:hypothetical protein
MINIYFVFRARHKSVIFFFFFFLKKTHLTMPKAKKDKKETELGGGGADATVPLPQLSSLSDDDRLMALLMIPQSGCAVSPELLRRVAAALSDPIADVRIAAAAALRSLLASADRCVQTPTSLY